MQTDDMGTDYICTIENNIEICMNKKSENPIIDARNYFEVKSGQIDDGIGSDVENTCKKGGITCISQSIFNVSKVIFIFFLSMITVIFLHEFVHFLVFALSGEDISGFTISIQGGYTNITLPDPTSHSIWWWYAALLLPTLVVNGGIILVNFLMGIDEDDRITVDTDENIYSNRFSSVFLRACGYTASIAILMSIFLYPMLDLKSNYFILQSDFSFAWNIGASAVQGTTLQLLSIFTAIGCATLSLLFIFIYGKKRN